MAASVVSAQELATLHVRSFTLASDRANVRVGEPFHLTATARLGEPIMALDNVTLPNLSGFEELGDERRCSTDGRGTTCVETLTLDATQPGDQTIGPASLSAVDARNGRPSRFITGSLLVRVAPTGALGATGVRDTLFDLAADVLRGSLIALFIVIAAAAIWWGFRRRRSAPIVSVEPRAPTEPEGAGRDASFGALVEELAREPTRERVVAVRRALRQRANAREHETLADLVRRGAVPDGSAQLALVAVERATFCEDPRLPEAVREALPYLR